MVTWTRRLRNVTAAFLTAGPWLACAWAAPAPTPVSPAPPPAIELRGTILGDLGKPLAKAVIRVRPVDGGKAIKVESGADGAFVARPPSGDTFRIRVEAKGYAALNESGIPAGAALRLKLKGGGAVTGIVLDRATRQPVAGASILAWELDAEGWGEDAFGSAKTGSDGKFTVPDLPPGRVVVEARAAGKANAKSPGTVSLPSHATPPAEGAKKPPPVELLLDPAGSLTGTVWDTSASPVAGAEVTAYWRETTGPRSRKATTDADGRYGIPGAAEVVIRRMTVRATGFPVLEREGEAPGDGVVDFTLERGGIVTGVVTSASGKLPASFRVVARPAASGPVVDRAFTDPAGVFRIEDLEPGRYTIEIAAERFAVLKKADVEVRGEQTADLGTLTLESKTTMRGRVLSARDESPILGASVRVSLVQAAAGETRPGSDTLWLVTSGADGSFTIRDLPAGTFEVSAEQPTFSPAKTRISFDPVSDSPELLLRLFRGGSVVGTVVDANGDPVPAVQITASQGPETDAHVAETGNDGRYSIDGLTPGAYQVSRQRVPGSRPAGVASKAATVREGEATTVDFDEAPKIVLSGTVRKGDEPLPNAAIYLFLLDGRQPPAAKKTQTDSQGAFQVGLDQSGRYQASIRTAAAGTPAGQNIVSLTVPDQPEVHQDIVFAANAITGRVNDPEGRPVKDAVMLAVREGAAAGETPRQATTYTKADGTFRMEGIDSGTYRVTAKASKYAPAEAYPVTVTDDQAEPNIELTLEHGWILRGRVTDTTGQPVYDAMIVVAAPGNAESGFLPSHTDRAGMFRITAPADGPVNVSAISPRFAPAVATDIQPAGSDDAPPVELRTGAGGSLRIRVVHRGGGPVAGAQPAYRPLMLYPGSDVVMDRNVPKRTDTEGASVITKLYPGQYVVSLVGRRDTAPAQVSIGEGTESFIEFEVP